MAYQFNDPFRPEFEFEYKGQKWFGEIFGSNVVLRVKKGGVIIGKLEANHLADNLTYGAIFAHRDIVIGIFRYKEDHTKAVVTSIGDVETVGNPLEFLVDFYLQG